MSLPGICQYNLDNPDIALDPRVEHIDLIHVSTTDSIGDYIEMGEVVGYVDSFPKILSHDHQDKIMKSRRLYANGKFAKASKVLDKAVISEPDNPFILNEFARALYRVEGKSLQCYETYKVLISQLDSSLNNSETRIAIDMWFREAYWKLGTLHMDNGNWSEAFYEINRFIMSIQNEKGTPVYEQALSYMTECAFELGYYHLCKHFAKRTLYYNPQNSYVVYYLNKISQN